MAGEHKVSYVKENIRNYPQFRWEGECSCGYHTKQANEEQVTSQLNAHMNYHGVSATQNEQKPPEPKIEGSKKFGTWKPLGASK